jgi:hypothetical protein
MVAGIAVFAALATSASADIGCGIANVWTFKHHDGVRIVRPFGEPEQAYACLTGSRRAWSVWTRPERPLFRREIVAVHTQRPFVVIRARVLDANIVGPGEGEHTNSNLLDLRRGWQIGSTEGRLLLGSDGAFATLARLSDGTRELRITDRLGRDRLVDAGRGISDAHVRGARLTWQHAGTHHDAVLQGPVGLPPDPSWRLREVIDHA